MRMELPEWVHKRPAVSWEEMDAARPSRREISLSLLLYLSNLKYYAPTIYSEMHQLLKNKYKFNINSLCTVDKYLVPSVPGSKGFGA